jgi:hypothetical protein
MISRTVIGNYVCSDIHWVSPQPTCA